MRREEEKHTLHFRDDSSSVHWGRLKLLYHGKNKPQQEIAAVLPLQSPRVKGKEKMSTHGT
jgi:hypothetical protein